ncbi:MFS transporter [Caldisericum exile]|uniref:Major facilitator superfamily protein n=1 Tax=Caldisericum exile (strain DSM 21853 / NBRC 104410 / AZM16c01) TaxID=511051 RepID=A0A7U6JEN2_CALEA|nr:MFS transporter [Caldisericum exile]BAL80901.1 major facilitator superfamily protein [Caldisericum exile AZM16c01]
MKKRLNPNVIILGLASFFTDISTEMITKILPLFLESIGAGGAFIGVIEGLAETIASLLKVFSGYISDKFRNRKWLTILGYAESTIAKAFLLIVNTPVGVLIVRALERIGKGIRTAPRDALIASYTDETNRGFYFGFHRALDTLGAALGPLLGFWVLEKFGRTNYREIFKFALIPAVVAVIILFFVQEKKVIVDLKKSSGFFAKAKLGKRFYLFLVAILIFTLGNSSDAFITMYSSSLGVASTTILLMWTLHSLIYAFLSTPLGTLSDKIGRKTTLIIGMAIYGISYLFFALTKSGNFLWFVFSLYGVYYAMSEGIQKAFVSDLVTDNEVRGTAFGIYNFAVGIMAFPASLVAGILYQFIAPSMPFYFGGILAIIASLLLLVV